MEEAERQVYAAYWLSMGVIYLLAMHFVYVVYSYWKMASGEGYDAQVDECE